jgi:hypothetical protein
VGGEEDGKRVQEGEYGANTVNTCMHMEEWDLLNVFQELGGVELKEHGGGGEFKHDIIWYIVRTFANATMYPHPAQQ